MMEGDGGENLLKNRRKIWGEHKKNERVIFFHFRAQSQWKYKSVGNVFEFLVRNFGASKRRQEFKFF